MSTNSRVLQVALKAAQAEWGSDLQDLVDFHTQSDYHKHDGDYVATGIQNLLAEADGAEVFEATLPAEHYRYATVTYYQYGVDEADAVRRLQVVIDEAS